MCKSQSFSVSVHYLYTLKGCVFECIECILSGIQKGGVCLVLFLCTVVPLSRFLHGKGLFSIGFQTCKKTQVRLPTYTMEHELKTV